MDGTWDYPPLAEVKAGAGITEVETYIAPRQNIVAQLIATRHIMELCMVETQILDERV